MEEGTAPMKKKRETVANVCVMANNESRNVMPVSLILTLATFSNVYNAK